MNNSRDYQPVIIVGAGRSGTNMLRDILTSIENFATWPCDEINYIWRHGNISKRTDEFSIEDINEKNKRYIRKQFDKLNKKTDANFIVEKTCANSLRVDFVDRVIPDAKYIHIYRNPIDVVSSAKKRWTASLDLAYILKKARYVPITDLPYYALKYFTNRIYKFFTKEKRLAYWGPKFKGMDEVLKNKSLEETCAIQWEKCVSNSIEAFNNINQSRTYHISYENFVKNPVVELDKILKFLEVDLDKKELKSLVKDVSTKSVGKGKRTLNQEVIKQIKSLTANTYERL
ncbi:sulfotransferase family protein [Selenihalanaerobacter shriftii]|uniref:Sulfotransferase domain-containing protein n=1 Tax=Selenihalanaerobacter shriftii TaxID=142842 RepID=A0A1T4R0J3_9FIRM|nr:sulfotransferase [Selenihalanaerobacter shriftii]SKA09500.1 Sulfotransferase domain-containing protein [Selenihalanaerobacter shriftii]